MKILVLNAGSSSHKSCLYDLPENYSTPELVKTPLWSAHIQTNVNTHLAELTVKTADCEYRRDLDNSQSDKTIETMLQTLVTGETKVIDSLAEIDLVGHRVVHGGSEYSEATLITPEVKKTIDKLSSLAPAHNPINLAGIEITENLLKNTPQVAVFDTAFHSQMPLTSAVYPIPYQYFTQGIRRYGFHGISHQYCAMKTAYLLQQPLSSLKIIICHLGNGCSLSAVKDGISINTTMGFTPLEGLMMGSRSGSIDPAILIYLIREFGLSADELETMLNKESGLKGVSGISSDLRTITTEIDRGNEKAQLAWDIYIHRLQTNIGAMLASLGGLDALVFTAGVGENSARVRQEAIATLGFINVKIDDRKNNNSPIDEDIATIDSAVRVLVIHTEEDWTIAIESLKLKLSLN